VEDEESLKPSALVGQFADPVEHHVDDLFADGVVATGVVVGGIFLAGDQLLGVEERTVGASTDFVDHSGFQIDKDGAGDVLARAALGEESVEGIVDGSDGLVTGHPTIRLDAVLQAVQLPASVAHLDPSLSYVD